MLSGYPDSFLQSLIWDLNAYNIDDLSKVIRIFTPDATLAQLVALAEASSYEDVLARRGKS